MRTLGAGGGHVGTSRGAAHPRVATQRACHVPDARWTTCRTSSGPSGGAGRARAMARRRASAGGARGAAGLRVGDGDAAGEEGGEREEGERRLHESASL